MGHFFYLAFVKNYLSLIKFAHTVFALPFAILGFVLAIHIDNNTFSWRTFILVIGAMIFARSAAMAFNRYLDRKIDALNERTQIREIPSGVINPRSALIFVILNSAAFITVSFLINPLCFYLSPVALLVVLGYSYTKRFTPLCHMVLGLGLSLAPIGAYLAVTSSFAWVPVLYGLAVLFWVSGFDIIYALQDEDFDRQNGLYSIPVALGTKNSLRLSKVLHLLVAIIIVGLAYILNEQYSAMQWIHWVGAVVFIGLLSYQHSLVSEGDLSKVNLAFFTTNGIASLLFCALVILDFYF